MSKKNKRRKQDHVWGPVITVLKDGFLGGLLLIAISHGVHVFSQSEEKTYEARYEVIKQFAIGKVALERQIDVCLSGGRITKEEKEHRLDARKKLVALVAKNKPFLPPDLFFNLAQYNRLDDADRLENLCSLNTDELKRLRAQIGTAEFKIQSGVQK